MIPFPELKAFQDLTLDDSSKPIFTVPAGEVYELLWVHIQVTTTNKAGNRQFRVGVYDNNGIFVLQSLTGEYVTASEAWEITWAPSYPLQEDETGVKLMLAPLPSPLLLPTGWQVVVEDYYGIDVAADHMTMNALVRRICPGE